VTSELTLRDYVELLRRRAWIVVSAFIGALVLALLYSALQTPLYRSSARIQINQNTANNIFDPVTGVSRNDRAATNEVELIKSQLVRTEAELRLGYPAGISARAETRADFVVVSAVNADAGRAQSIAQTYAEAYLDVRTNEFIEGRLQTADKLLERIQEIDAEIAAIGPEGNAVRQQALRDNLADPRANRNLTLGGILGLVIGAGGALLIESLDRTIKSRQIIEGLTPGVPALASIPTVKSEHAVISLAHPEGLESEVFRTLRAGIEFASIDRRIQVIQVTSPGPSAGKTTVAANLAVVMAQAGQKVAVVDADLRRPRLHDAFKLPQVPGISSVIIGRVSGAEAAHQLNLNNGRLWVFPSGPIPPGPSELLGSERARATFDALRDEVDVIIVDSAPVLPVADALVLSRLADATIVVANARLTKRDEVTRAIEQLHQAGANIIGTVLNQVKGNSSVGDGYGYGYGYGYAYGGSGRSLLDQLLGRNKNVAPKLEGTATIGHDELPRFKRAQPTLTGEVPVVRTKSSATDGPDFDDAPVATSASVEHTNGSEHTSNGAASNDLEQTDVDDELDSADDDSDEDADLAPTKASSRRAKANKAKVIVEDLVADDVPSGWADEVDLK